MSELEPIGFDSMGVPRYQWQIGDRLDDETRRRLREQVDRDEA